MKRIAPIVILTLLFSMSAFVATAANSTVVVHPGDMNGWAFADDNGQGGDGELVTGPSSPPLGTGSVRLSLSNSLQGYVIYTTAHQGTRFADITALEYSTYRSSGDPALAIALQFNVDYDLTDANELWQQRLIFEPYHDGTVNTGEWQTWDATTDKGWWANNAIGAAHCPQSSPCTLAEFLGHFPEAGVHTTLGAVIFKAGSGWAGFDGNADEFTIGVNGVNTTYDFEFDAPPPPVIGPPTNKDECKNGGWQSFNNPAFSNQGECVSFVTSNEAN